MRTPQVPTLADAKLIDASLLEVQSSLVSKLSWLNHAFGKAQQLKEEKDGRVITYPGVYVGKKEYLNVFPDGHIGNFTFFDIRDGEDIDHQGPRNIDFTAQFGLIVWFDFRKVYSSDWQARTVENVKFEVVQALKTTVISAASIRLFKSWERSHNIYKGYTDDSVKNQYLMRPFGGFRIDGEISFRELQNC